MNILVAYASKHGSTAQIAERIAGTLGGHGHVAEAIPVASIRDPLDFDVVIVGSAVYMGRWMNEAVDFVRLHESQLARRPLWLFSSGPVGPKVLPEATDVARMRERLGISGHRTFHGALDAARLSLPERMMIKAVKAPYGDFRQWEIIDDWAEAIANSMTQTAPLAVA